MQAYFLISRITKGSYYRCSKLHRNNRALAGQTLQLCYKAACCSLKTSDLVALFIGNVKSLKNLRHFGRVK